jgi:hypothetical protein
MNTARGFTEGRGRRERTGLDVLGDLARLEAGGADPDPAGHAVHQSAHGLEIRIPAAEGDVVGMRDVVPELGLLATHDALTGHGNLTNPNTAKPKED